MELLEHDLKNVEELLFIITHIDNYYKNHPSDNSNKSFQQPIFFIKPKNIIKWFNPGLNITSKMKLIDVNDLTRDRGLFDTDLIWYNNYILTQFKPLITHHPLDWQLISISTGSITPENKIYVNTNPNSNLYNFYIYSPGGYDKEFYGYYILATSHFEFNLVWNNIVERFNNISDFKLIDDGKDIPISVINNMITVSTSLFDNYYTCSESECNKKKQQILSLLGLNIECTITIRECGICYWVLIESGNNIILAGDLFYHRILDNFVTFGKSTGFSSWEISFEKLSNVIDIENER